MAMKHKITDNFYLEEFDCRDGTQVPEEYVINIVRLAKNLQQLRQHLDLPVQILSGYRSPEHNERVKGVKNSQHLLGKAADIHVLKTRPLMVFKTIENLIATGIMEEGGLGLYKTFVHYDIRGYKARW
jgi:uncharacterized protein YcbK (DUF882 family)